MRSAALPLLPSIRAKELEEKAKAYSQENTSQEDAGELARHAVETPSRSNEDQQCLIENIDLRPTAPSIAPSQLAKQRSEQLTLLHHKEQKVFGGLPPLESDIACNVMHQYISTTSAFLNSFIADANASNEGIDRKLTVLEKQMSLLESKMASIPDLFPEVKEGDEDNEKGSSE